MPSPVTAGREEQARSLGTRPSGDADLTDRLVGVLRVASDHVARLDEYAHLWGDSEDPFISLADKIVVESAILVLVAIRVSRDRLRIRNAALELANRLAPYARSHRNRVLLLRQPRTATSLGIAHLALAHAGLPDPSFDSVLGSALASGQDDALERLPYRALEREWVAGLFFGRQRWPIASLLQQSVAGRRAHPIYMVANDVYALTHVPMFVTDFGAAPPPPEFPLASACASIDASIAWTLYTANFDLLAELLLARDLLDAPWSPYQELGWHALEDAWGQLGFLACPSFEVRHFDDLPLSERSAYAFRHVYHTTYVGGMLFAALIRDRARGRIANASQDTDDPSLRARCAAAVRAAERFSGQRTEMCQPQPCSDEHLLATAAALARITINRDDTAEEVPLRALETAVLDRRAAATVLIDGALTLSARAYDLPMLARTLDSAAQLGVDRSPTIVEAVRFLLRQQAPSGGIGAWHVLPCLEVSDDAKSATTRLASPLVSFASGWL